ncbi:MarR family winged helix-turn-helix transcriptional regulator [Flexivirga caeni]|uniref:MarR family transcriptional regulator n=1 Tax=Flexivirga caeni TaxID=2294115 RepID=A0A3M9MIS2_9MICO|nr:MarR family transcriptional regulator [Flexivirga caeni]RNI25406.1 MarR family transcriptional regulator [Flexivirga caeni]
MSVDHAIASELSVELIHLVKKIEARRLHAKRQADVEASSYPVLFDLHRGPARVSALAEHVHSDVSTVSRQVTSLVTQGLVAKVSDPDDGRAQRVALTSDGDALIARLQDLRVAWIQGLLSDWTNDEAITFANQLHRLSTALGGELDRSRGQSVDLDYPTAPTTRKDAS